MRQSNDAGGCIDDVKNDDDVYFVGDDDEGGDGDGDDVDYDDDDGDDGDDDGSDYDNHDNDDYDDSNDNNGYCRLHIRITKTIMTMYNNEIFLDIN